MSHQRIQVLGPAQRVISSDGRLTVIVPIKMRLGGIRRVKPPDGPPKLLTSLQNALIQAHRWQRMLDRGEITQIGELARQEKQDHAYVSRLLNLTTLSPWIVEAILDAMNRSSRLAVSRSCSPLRLSVSAFLPFSSGLRC